MMCGNSGSSVIKVGAKRILGCSSRTCNEALRGLINYRDKAKLKW